MPRDQFERFRSLPGWSDRVAGAHTVVREIHAHIAYRFEGERWRDRSTPTLLLLGGESAPLFAAAIDLLAATLPRATVRVLDGQHHVAMETAPARFAAEI
jgi:pimeloyl-ACP methyl ester carboxylesterase